MSFKTRPESTKAVPLFALALSALLGVVALGGPIPGFNGAALADSHSDAGHADDGHGGSGQGQGGQGQGNQGEGNQSESGQGQGDQGGQGQSDQGGHGEGAQGQGGPGEDSEGQGPRAGSPAGSSGIRPPWAGEGIPEVELGRLNVARSPEHVLDRAYAEALAQLATMATFYNLTHDEMITELTFNWENITLIDSPLQNLSLLRDALDGSIDLSAYGITNDRDTLMAVFLGVASDKVVDITPDTAYAVSVILGMPLTEAEAIALAAQAEAIRIAVLAGHG